MAFTYATNLQSRATVQKKKKKRDCGEVKQTYIDSFGIIHFGIRNNN